MMAHCARTGEPIDIDRVRDRLDGLAATDDLQLAERRTRLGDALGTHQT
jgi:hypothetical protein